MVQGGDTVHATFCTSLVLLKILGHGRHILIPSMITAVSQTHRSIICIADGHLRTIITLAIKADLCSEDPVLTLSEDPVSLRVHNSDLMLEDARISEQCEISGAALRHLLYVFSIKTLPNAAGPPHALVAGVRVKLNIS